MPAISLYYGDALITKKWHITDDTPDYRKVVVKGYESHGGRHFDLDLFVRPDRGDGYGPGSAYADRVPRGGDLCLLVAGNATGQIISTIGVYDPDTDSMQWNTEPRRIADNTDPPPFRTTRA